MGQKGSGTYFLRSMSNTVLAGREYQICELYIDDVLIHGRDFVPFLHNVRKVFVHFLLCDIVRIIDILLCDIVGHNFDTILLRWLAEETSMILMRMKKVRSW